MTRCSLFVRLGIQVNCAPNIASKHSFLSMKMCSNFKCKQDHRTFTGMFNKVCPRLCKYEVKCSVSCLKKVYKRQLFNPTSHKLVKSMSCHVKDLSVYSTLIFYTLGDVFDFLACLTDMRIRNSERPDLIFLNLVVYT